MITESIINFFNRVMCFTSFVKKSSGFPDPLTSEEELECITKFKTEGDLEAKNRLIYHNLRLVAHIVKKYSQCAEEGEDNLTLYNPAGKGAMVISFLNDYLHRHIWTGR